MSDIKPCLARKEAQHAHIARGVAHAAMRGAAISLMAIVARLLIALPRAAFTIISLMVAAFDIFTYLVFFSFFILLRQMFAHRAEEEQFLPAVAPFHACMNIG